MSESPPTRVLVTLTALIIGIVGTGGCVGAPRPAADGNGDVGPVDTAIAGQRDVPTPVPVADAVDPTPINDPAEGAGHADTSGEAGVPGSVWLPWLGLADTIDLLDLLATGGLDDALDPATENPGSFTTLELLCRDQGLPRSYCRSRYGGL